MVKGSEFEGGYQDISILAKGYASDVMECDRRRAELSNAALYTD